MSLELLGHGFSASSDQLLEEAPDRDGLYNRVLTFGVNYLDKITRGILPDDLVLVGARTGAGKTQFCSQLAVANARRGKKVHFLALEASKFEIERRIKFMLLSELVRQNPLEVSLPVPLNFGDWNIGRFDSMLKVFESRLVEQYQNYANLYTFYKNSSRFGVDEMVKHMVGVSHETDLIIIDHLHYFDWDHDNDNRALKEIVKTLREMCQVICKPVVMVAHLRKRDPKFAELVPNEDEFHGSSDIVKIASKIITFAKGRSLGDGRAETLFRVPKCRIDGSVTQFIGSVVFDTRTTTYEKRFDIGVLSPDGRSFEQISEDRLPFWMR